MSIVIRSLITVLLFSFFIALWFWAWRKENAGRFANAAQLPLEDAASDSGSDDRTPSESPTV